VATVQDVQDVLQQFSPVVRNVLFPQQDIAFERFFRRSLVRSFLAVLSPYLGTYSVAPHKTLCYTR